MQNIIRALLLAALSLGFISCEDDTINPPDDRPGILDVSITESDYTLNSVHKSYYNPFFIEGNSYYYNHTYGLTLSLKLNNPSRLDIIDHLVIAAADSSDTLAYTFDKYQLHELFSDTLGGFIIPIDSLYIEGRNEYYPDKEYEWTVKLYDKDGNSGMPFKMTAKTNSYIYYDVVSSLLWEGGLKINFSGALSSITYREVKVFLFDSQKKYVKDYSFREIDPDYSELTFTDVPANAVFYRVLLRDVYNGVKRTYTGRFEDIF